MGFEKRLRGLFQGLIQGEAHATARGSVEGSTVSPAAGLLQAAMTSLAACDGFDGPDQARGFAKAVAEAPAAFAPLERFAAAIVEDGADWQEPSRLMAAAPGAGSHHAAVRALAAAVVAVDNEPYRSWLAGRLVGLTHRSSLATTAGMMVADAAAALLRGEGPSLDAPFEPLAARTVSGERATPCAVDVARAVVVVGASAPTVRAALEQIEGRWWADGRAMALAGALVGARTGALPESDLAVVRPGPVDDLVRRAQMLADRGRAHLRFGSVGA
jgi:hypothetical protein